jgi:2Fe-2S ferredoxin
MVNAEWLAKTGGADEAEDSMLDLNPERAENSRLSCQMMVSDDLDGLIVDLPEFQF